jgi:hypothetical protein
MDCPDLMDGDHVKNSLEHLEFLHKDAVNKKSLEELWNRFSALDPYTLGGLLYSESVMTYLKKELRKKYECKFEDEDLKEGLNKLLLAQIDLSRIKVMKVKSAHKKVVVKKIITELHDDTVDGSTVSQGLPGNGS